ncbi:MAG: hypothetical protein WCO84_07025 [bacterium]
MKMLVGVVLFSLFLAWATHGWKNVEGTQKAAEASSMTEIVVGEGSLFSCPSDFYCTRFDAKNAQGNAVSGVVGCGFFFKACTVRW